MLCTQCGSVIDPVVVLDIDGTLGDYHTHFLRFAKAYLGLDEVVSKPYTGIGSFREWYTRATGIDDRTWHDIKLAYRQGAQKRSMPVFDNAAELTQSLMMRGAEVWLCTTRPFMRLDNVDPDTRFWLDLHGIKYDGLIHDEAKYEKMASYVDSGRVVAVLEDEAEQLGDADHYFNGAAILRHNNYNRLVSHSPSVYDLTEARAVILHSLDQWREENSHAGQAH